MDGLFFQPGTHHGNILADLGMEKLQKPIKQECVRNVCFDLPLMSTPLMDMISDVSGISLLKGS
jgi:hypothetical protein